MNNKNRSGLVKYGCITFEAIVKMFLRNNVFIAL